MISTVIVRRHASILPPGFCTKHTSTTGKKKITDDEPSRIFVCDALTYTYTRYEPGETGAN